VVAQGPYVCLPDSVEVDTVEGAQEVYEFLRVLADGARDALRMLEGEYRVGGVLGR
jgi:hypothetical protein